MLIVNICLLIVGGAKNGGYTNGIGTLDDGDAGPMKKLGLIYHVLIISAHLVKMEAGKARLYKDCIGWPKTQLLGAPTPATSPRWRCCQWP